MKLTTTITAWIYEYAQENKINSLVVGVSGGIDSAVVSTLCAKTGLPTILVNMPILQRVGQIDRAMNHINWLADNHDNVSSMVINLDKTYDLYTKFDLSEVMMSDLVKANTRARLRMTTLYAVAGSNNGIVVGTGNKVEDFGVGFFTKYGDGGVDISPIADFLKSEVYEMAKELGISQEIQDAPPTDGLWGDDRTDEDQLGATYDELEWAMGWFAEFEKPESDVRNWKLTERQNEVLEIYDKLHKSNLHKMTPIPIFQNCGKFK